MDPVPNMGKTGFIVQCGQGLSLCVNIMKASNLSFVLGPL